MSDGLYSHVPETDIKEINAAPSETQKLAALQERASQRYLASLTVTRTQSSSSTARKK